MVVRITSIAYNAFHDQLVLTGSSDTLVNLFSIYSISSASIPAPATFHTQSDESDHSDESENEFGIPEDGIVESYDHHEDSVYGVVWSAGDPCIF